MLHVCFDCYGSYTTDSVYQWDLNRQLSIKGLDFDSAPSIHFTNKTREEALVVQSSISDGVITCDVPNILLQERYDITAYICSLVDQKLVTYETIKIPIIRRAKPANYVYTDNVEITTYDSLMAEITRVDDKLTDYMENNSQALEDKADKLDLEDLEARVKANEDNIALITGTIETVDESLTAIADTDTF